MLWGNLLTGNPMEILGTLQPLHCIYHIPNKRRILNEVLIAHPGTREIEISMWFPWL